MGGARGEGGEGGGRERNERVGAKEGERGEGRIKSLQPTRLLSLTSHCHCHVPAGQGTRDRRTCHVTLKKQSEDVPVPRLCCLAPLLLFAPHSVPLLPLHGTSSTMLASFAPLRAMRLAQVLK